MNKFEFKTNHSTNYASELPKLHKLLMQAYADYDADKVWKLRETRKQYRVKIAEGIEDLGVDIGDYEGENWYDESLDKLTYQAQYLESMYNSGAPMNANQVEALILTRGVIMIYPKDDKLKAITYKPNVTWVLINGIYTKIEGR